MRAEQSVEAPRHNQLAASGDFASPANDPTLPLIPDGVIMTSMGHSANVGSSTGDRTMGDSNADIIRKAYQDFSHGNIPAVFAAFDSDITWHVPGHGPLSGSYAGHDQIGAFFQRTMELSGGVFSIDVQNVLAEGDLVVVLATVNAQRKGISASFPEVHVWQMKNGKAIGFREYQGDEQGEDRFWS